MSIAWATVAILVLLLPGFLFFSGLYAQERFSRDAARQSAIGQLAGIVLVALFVHGTVYPLTTALAWLRPPELPARFWPKFVDFEILFAVLQLDGADAVPLRRMAANIRESWFWIWAYLLASSWLGFGLGWVASRQMALGRWRWLAQMVWKHQWIYDLAARDQASLTLVYVLTNIREGPRVVMYRGFLQDIFGAPDGRLSYLVLWGCIRYYMRLDEPAPETSNPRDWRVIGASARASAPLFTQHQRSYMIIEGEDIANVLFERYTFQATQAAQQALFEPPHGPQPQYAPRKGRRSPKKPNDVAGND